MSKEIFVPFSDQPENEKLSDEARRKQVQNLARLCALMLQLCDTNEQAQDILRICLPEHEQEKEQSYAKNSALQELAYSSSPMTIFDNNINFPPLWPQPMIDFYFMVRFLSAGYARRFYKRLCCCCCCCCSPSLFLKKGAKSICDHDSLWNKNVCT